MEEINFWKPKKKAPNYPECVGNKIKSKGMGRGLGKGKGKGPIGIPYKQKNSEENA